MKRFFLVGFVVLASLTILQDTAAAQGNFGLNVGAEFLLPITSTFKDFYNIGFGGSVRGEYAVTPDMSLMLSVGYISLTAKDIGGVTPDNGQMIPIVAGVKYYFMPGTLRFYGAFDLGITSFKQSVTLIPALLPGMSPTTASATSTEFTWEPQLGFIGLFSDNAAFDLGVRWIGISDANSLGVRFGVLFMFGGGRPSGKSY